MNKFQEMIKIADIHADKISLSLKKSSHLFPADKTVIETLQENDLLWIELLISRFGKLQDFLGNKLIDAFLEANEEDTRSVTMLDKINKLERLGVIENAALWREMREARNHISHEYPEHPELTAKYLNKIFSLSPQLLLIFNTIKKSLKKSSYTK